MNFTFSLFGAIGIENNMAFTGDIPSGTIDGSNTIFTLAHTPNPASALILVLNGIILQASGNDYTLSGNSITFVVPPPVGSTMQAWYTY